VNVPNQARAVFPAEAGSAASARHFVSQALRAWGADEAVPDTTLLTCEAVTNALVHAGTDIEVTCSLEGTAVRVEVADLNRARLVPDPANDSQSGRGLLIVDQIADSWGITYTGATKSVWFRRSLTDGPADDPCGGAMSVLPGPRQLAWDHDAPPDLAKGLPELAAMLEEPGLNDGGLDQALMLIQSAVGAEVACVFRLDSDPGWLLLEAGVGRVRAPRGIRLPARGVFGLTDVGLWPVLFDDLPSKDWTAPDLSFSPRRSLVLARLVADGQTIGVLKAAAAAAHRFDQHTAAFMQRAADLLAVPLHRLWLAQRTQERLGWLTFLAEASSLLAGHTDADEVATLTTLLVVPRLADWCAVYTTDDAGSSRLAHIWHTDERALDSLRSQLARDEADHDLPEMTKVPLERGGLRLGTLLAGGIDPAVGGRGARSLLDDLGARVAVALETCRSYNREATTSQILRRSLLPSPVASIPGIESSVLYEPASADIGGDFYDLFQVSRERWYLVLGDACGNGPEAAAITGVARNIVRLLARDGRDPAAILARLNRAVIDDYAPDRFLSMLCAEVHPVRSGGARLRLASAGHPLPLLLDAAGAVGQVGEPHLLLGIERSPDYRAQLVELDAGDALICVTDGVTERSDGIRQLDDEDGLTHLVAGFAGLSADEIAGRIHTAVAEFGSRPPHDDVAALVLRAVRLPS
jgi:anti-sigma regulatory factor (Ser/Thr protein kinase)